MRYQTMGVRQDRVHGRMSGEVRKQRVRLGRRCGTFRRVTVLYQLLQRAALQRELLEEWVYGGPLTPVSCFG